MRVALKRRILDYVLYVACGSVVSIGVAAPFIWGMDPDWYLPRAIAVGSSLAVIGLLAYDLRPWLRFPTLWLFLLAVGGLNVFLATELQRNHASFNVVLWIIACTVQLYTFEWLFKALARLLNLQPK